MSERPTSGALLVVGATSGAGKSTLVSALCRAWSDAGRDVAPFKAQNMSNHAAVTTDGGEIGRAQAMQALAARVEPERRMNPVLLKPSSERSSHVVVLGGEVSLVDASGYGSVTQGLRATVLDSFVSLRRDHAWVVAEGAGGAAEINLLRRDIVNLPLAAAAGMSAVLVVDIDRGGAFAAAHGTLDLLPPRLRDTVRGIVVNRIRGDASLLEPGLRELERRCGTPVLGVLPHLGPGEPMLAAEDSLDLDLTTPADASVERPVRVAVVRLPHLANASDLDPLVLEPSVELTWATRPEHVRTADLVVVPGSRATLADLAWLRSRGIDRTLATTPAHILGICAGYQMLGRSLADPDGIEAAGAPGPVAGLGLLPVETTYAAPKTVRRVSGRSVSGLPVTGYEIRWGRPVADRTAMPWFELADGVEGCVAAGGRVRGTSVHGLLDLDDLRTTLLTEVARAHGREFAPASTGFADARETHLDRLAAWLGARVDTEHLADLAASAVPVGEEPGW